MCFAKETVMFKQFGSGYIWATFLAAMLSRPALPQSAPDAGPAQRQRVQNRYELFALSSGPWKGPTLSDGQPDVQGFWFGTVPGLHFNLSDPQGAHLGSPQRPEDLGPREARAPSRVSDPADGQVPFQPWALAKVEDFAAHAPNPTKPQYVDTQARCAPSGAPKGLYWHPFEIIQKPGVVLLAFSNGTRIIYLDGRPHLPANIKLWNGDSRGHWEGNTLVVDVTNQNGKPTLAATGEFYGENTHVQERYVFDNDRERLLYHAVITDPTIYTRPFTITVPERKQSLSSKPQPIHTHLNKGADGQPVLESDELSCVEFNEGHGDEALDDASK
jgi:hypothetical protein